MKIKRIFAPDMRQAIRKVRDELGPDAVILSSRKVEGGMEVISAVDYDERVIRAAVEDEAPQPDFAETFAKLKAARRAEPAAAEPRRKIDVSIDDDVDLALSFSEPEPPRSMPQPEPVRAAAPSLEWTQEPAIAEMRQELKALRSMFESQLTLMEWKQMGEREPVRMEVLKQLNELGLGNDVSRKIADHVARLGDPEKAWAKAL